MPFQLVAPMLEAMHYTYVLLGEMDRRFYIGATRDLRARVADTGQAG